MFEGTLVESRGLLASNARKWTALGSLALQTALAALLMVIPMLRPQILPLNLNAPHITVPELRQKQVVQRVEALAARTSAAVSAPANSPVVEDTRGVIVREGKPVDDDNSPPYLGQPILMGGGTGLTSLAVLGSTPGSAVAVVRAVDTRPVRISQGVSSGMLLSAITPAYPAIARAAGVQGAVVLEAVISTTGRIESLHVVSGPALLRQAALDAVSSARYLPYRLNGDPIEVQTTISVVFRMGT